MNIFARSPAKQHGLTRRICRTLYLVFDRSVHLTMAEVPFLDKLEIVTRLSRSKGLAPVTNVVSPPLKDSAGQQQKTDQNVGQCIRRSVPSLRVCNLVNSPRSSSKQIESFQKEVQQKPAENNTGFKRKRTSDNLLKQPIAIDLKPGAVVLFAMFSLYFGIY